MRNLRNNENDGAPAGFATLADTPGMGDVVMPTATSKGSGDIFGGVMSFGSWSKSRKAKRAKRKRKK